MSNLEFCNQGLTMDDVVYILTLQASLRLWLLLQSTYIMVYKSAYACKLHSITQKWVRSNVSRWFTRLYNSWMTIKIDANYETLIIDYWNFGLSMNALTNHVADSRIRTMTVIHVEHQGVCVTNGQRLNIKIRSRKIWMPREDHGVRQVIAAWAHWC